MITTHDPYKVFSEVKRLYELGERPIYLPLDKLEAYWAYLTPNRFRNVTAVAYKDTYVTAANVNEI